MGINYPTSLNWLSEFTGFLKLTESTRITLADCQVGEWGGESPTGFLSIKLLIVGELTHPT